MIIKNFRAALLSLMSIMLLVFSCSSLNANSSAITPLDYYLPSSADYLPSIATPESLLGYQVGDWHVRPDQVVNYFQTLASQSDRVKVEVIGYTHEKRPLIHVFISSKENLQRLEGIRQDHLKGNKPATTPLVTWMGYSVHGNEASGSNASLLLGYHLAAAQDAATLEQLKDQVIIIDPMLNPDGLARFAQWVNSYRSVSLHGDRDDIGHHEAWPQARTNHYWFDLNRDWLLLQHPESRARVERFQLWRPNILTDFHEMGTDSSYFFQPGVPSRQNPMTSKNNFTMTAKIAEYHAKALDDIGSLYYSKEDFDDFYYGKGSTYPDIHGSVGILFEQASSRGYHADSDYGQLTFPFAVRNHLTTSLSTIKAAQHNQASLKKMQRDFKANSNKQAKSDRRKAIVVATGDNYRRNQMALLLKGHDISFYPLAKRLEIKDQLFKPQHSLIIPLQQPQYALIKALFETSQKFNDKVFYDVSAWNVARAMDMDYAFVDRSDYSDSLLSAHLAAKKAPIAIKKETIAVAFDWQNFDTARLLAGMQQLGLRVQALAKASELKGANSTTQLSPGSLVLALSNQELSREEIIQWLTAKLLELDLELIEITSGLAINGIDMGSPSAKVLKTIKPLLLIGDGTSSYSVGEIWHLLDQRLSLPLTRMTLNQLSKLKHIDYSHLILAGNKPKFSDELTEKLSQWVKEGGTIIAHGEATEWFAKQNWISSELKEFNNTADTQVSYSNKDQVDAQHHIGGAITLSKIDTSHPLGFGLDNDSFAIFKRGQRVFSEPKEAFVAVARFAKQPLISGYMSKENQKHIADGTSIFVQGLGRGKLIGFSDNPVFRGYWLGTARVFVNALYLSQLIEAPEKSQDKPAKDDK